MCVCVCVCTYNTQVPSHNTIVGIERVRFSGFVCLQIIIGINPRDAIIEHKKKNNSILLCAIKLVHTNNIIMYHIHIHVYVLYIHINTIIVLGILSLILTVYTLFLCNFLPHYNNYIIQFSIFQSRRVNESILSSINQI